MSARQKKSKRAEGVDESETDSPQMSVTSSPEITCIPDEQKELKIRIKREVHSDPQKKKSSRSRSSRKTKSPFGEDFVSPDTISNDSVESLDVSEVHSDGGDPGVEEMMDVSTEEGDECPVSTQVEKVEGSELMCALCNCGEKSLLGQGDIMRYEPTPNFNPFKKQLKQQLRRGSTEFDERGDKSPKPLTWRRSRGPLKQARERSKSPRRPNPHTLVDEEGRPIASVDEINTVGYPENTQLTELFEPTGHTTAHHCCAAWSEGVLQAEDYSLLYVDKAVFAGLTTKCSFCRHYGATIHCRYQKCSKRYHYPCASGSGCFQDIKTLTLLCPEHTDQAEAIAGTEACCVVCDVPGDILEQLFCTSCGQHYHGNCLDPPVEVNPVVRAGWQCPECKICQTCRQPGDDNKMLVCDTCDKGYHTFCLRPVMTTIPKNGWKCKNCRVCGDCGSRTPGSGPSSRWHLNYSVCDSCYQQRNKGLSCPLCCKAYRHFTQKTMMLCDACKKYVHAECDVSITQEMLAQQRDSEPSGYLCPICKNRDPRELDSIECPDQESSNLTDSLNSMIDEADFKDLAMFNMFKGEESSVKEGTPANDDGLISSQESLMLNEDSLSSIDIDFGSFEKNNSVKYEVTTSANTFTSKPHGKGKGKPSIGKKSRGLGIQKKSKNVCFGKKKRPLFDSSRKRSKVKFKAAAIQQLTPMQTSVAETSSSVVSGSKSKEDDGDEHQTTVVLAGYRDMYTLGQDMCVSCGSYGRGEEGRLIVCTQCGQCYHPYCVSIKVTSVILEKGWRCLDCTVCEGCGKPHDEGRLLLCDECDVSFHIYCLDPPLTTVPKGTWKCKRCVICMNCGSKSPGFGCLWQNNYTQCAPCCSITMCPVCNKKYKEEEAILQCTQCDRWLHGLCDGLRTDDELERASDMGYHCLMCRPKTGAPPPLPPPDPEPELPSPVPKEPEPPKPKQDYVMDGVLLSENGFNQIRSLSMTLPVKKRVRRSRSTAEQVKTPSALPVDGEESKMSTEDAEEIKAGEESLDTEDTKTPDVSESTSLPLSTELPSPTLKRNRYRRPAAALAGIGGFIVRHRNRGSNTPKTPGVAPNTTAPSAETPNITVPPTGPVAGGEVLSPGVEGSSLDMPPVGDVKTDSQTNDQPKPKKKRRPKRKGALEESFPHYLQEAFFGKAVLDVSKDKSQKQTIEQQMDEGAAPVLPSSSGSTLEKAVEESSIDQSIQQAVTRAAEEDINTLVEGDLKDILPTDLPFGDLAHDSGLHDDLLGMLGDELSKEPESQPSEGHVAETKHPLGDNLEHMLNPNLDVDKNIDVEKMLHEGLAQIDSKTVEDLFKGVLNAADSQPASDPQFQLNQMSSSEVHKQGTPLGDPHPPLAHFEPGMPPPYHHSPGIHSPGYSEANPWSQPAPEEGEGDRLSYNMRNILKWEKDEALGDKATISPVLYANLNHPELKTEHPEWTERSKQIAKLWRKVPSEQRAPYLAKARENRANSRLHKAQKLSKELKTRKPDAETGEGGQQLKGAEQTWPLKQEHGVISDKPPTPSSAGVPQLPSPGVHQQMAAHDRFPVPRMPFTFPARPPHMDPAFVREPFPRHVSPSSPFGPVHPGTMIPSQGSFPRPPGMPLPNFPASQSGGGEQRQLPAAAAFIATSMESIKPPSDPQTGVELPGKQAGFVPGPPSFPAEPMEEGDMYFGADGDGQRPDRVQLRQLLANHSKKRQQNKKKQEMEQQDHQSWPPTESPPAGYPSQGDGSVPVEGWPGARMAMGPPLRPLGPRMPGGHGALMPRIPGDTVGLNQMTPAERQRSPYLQMFRDRLRDPRPMLPTYVAVSQPNTKSTPNLGLPGAEEGAAVQSAEGVKGEKQEKIEESLDDLLGADGTFNLLEEFADPELDKTLAEAHDKSMFDEHLGIKDEDPSGDTGTEKGGEKAAVGTQSSEEKASDAPTTESAGEERGGDGNTAGDQDVCQKKPEENDEEMLVDPTTGLIGGQSHRQLEVASSPVMTTTVSSDSVNVPQATISRPSTQSPRLSQPGSHQVSPVASPRVTGVTSPHVTPQGSPRVASVQSPFSKVSSPHSSSQSPTTTTTASTGTSAIPRSSPQMGRPSASSLPDRPGSQPMMGSPQTSVHYSGHPPQSPLARTPPVQSPSPGMNPVRLVAPPHSMAGPMAAPPHSMPGVPHSMAGALHRFPGPQLSMAGATHLVGPPRTMPPHAMAGPPHSIAGPPHSMPGPPHSMPGPPHSMPGPPHSMPGPPHSIAGPPHSRAGPPFTMEGPPHSMAMVRPPYSMANVPFSMAQRMPGPPHILGRPPHAPPLRMMGGPMPGPHPMPAQSPVPTGPSPHGANDALMAGPRGAAHRPVYSRPIGPTGPEGLRHPMMPPRSMTPRGPLSPWQAGDHPRPAMIPSGQPSPGPQKGNGMLLSEQPLLIQDLLEQEKIEQQRQAHQQVIMRKEDARPPRPRMPGHEGWPRHHFPPREQMSPHGFPPPYPGRHPGQPPFTGPLSPHVPPPHSPGLRSPLGQPPFIPTPPSSAHDGLTDAERQQQMKYEEWLMQHANMLSMQIRSIEKQLAQHKKTKKVLNGRQKQLRKQNQELSQQELMELERASQEQSAVQKQLELIRKQQKQHQQLFQEYRTKQQEKYGSNWPAPAPLKPGPPQSPMISPPVPRMPGAPNTARMPASARQEYEQYMQNRLRMIGVGEGPRTPVVHTDENNPFSESYQEREKLEKVREQREQQERLRLQMQQQVDHQRALQMQATTGEGSPMSPAQQFPGTPFPDRPMAMQGQGHGPIGVPGLPQQQGAAPPPQPGGTDDQAGDNKSKKKRKRRTKKEIEAEREAKSALTNLGLNELIGKGPKLPAPGTMMHMSSGTPVTCGQLYPAPRPISTPSYYLAGSTNMPSRPGEPTPDTGQEDKKETTAASDAKDGADPSGDKSTVGDCGSKPKESDVDHHDIDSMCRTAAMAGSEIRDMLSSSRNVAIPTSSTSDESSKGNVADGQEDLSKAKGTENILLKRLLEAPRGPATKEEEDQIVLTPEQQRQLAMIDSMPLVMEREISQEEWESKTAEERQRILELRYESLHPPAQPEATTEVSPKTKKAKVKRKKVDSSKKVNRKPKSPVLNEETPSVMDGILAQLKALPAVPLQEPAVITSSLLTVMGQSVETGVSPLRGVYGQAVLDSTRDYYSHFPLGSAIQQSPVKTSTTPVVTPVQPQQDGTGQKDKASTSQTTERPGVMASEIIRELDSQHMSAFPALGRPLTMPSPPLIGPRLDIPTRSSNTPDTIVSSSSPECMLGETDTLYPVLQVIKDEKTSPEDRLRECRSPFVPLVAPIPVRPVTVKHEIKKEIPEQDVSGSWKRKKEEDSYFFKNKENFGLLPEEPVKTKAVSLSQPLKDYSNQVSVTLTLSNTAAEDVKGVLSAVADLLNIAVPLTYNISRSSSPELFKQDLKHKEEAIHIQSLMKTKPKFCRHCDVHLPLSGKVTKKKSELPFLTRDEQEAEGDQVYFCSTTCYMQFSISRRSSVAEPVKCEGGNLVEHKNQDSDKAMDLVAPVAVLKKSETKDKNKNRRRSSSVDSKPPPKKWKGIKWRKWDITFGTLQVTIQPMTQEQVNQLMDRLCITIRPEPAIEDTRRCILCHTKGDSETDGPARLLNYDSDKWVHLNCALWSYEVFETVSGALMHVGQAHRRGQTLECVVCRYYGATLSCFKQRCANIYHVGCAQKKGCMFFEDKTILCPIHKPKGGGPVDMELTCLSVFRKVYVNRDEDKQLANVIHEEEHHCTVRIGTVYYYNVGQLLLHQIQTNRFHTKDCIYPVGFKSSRFYWSTRYMNKRCRYVCAITDNDGRPEFSITIKESGNEDVTITKSSPKAAWSSILSSVEKIRLENDQVKMFPEFLSGEDLFGLTEPTIVRVIESLPGTELLSNYHFKYGRLQLIEMPLTINPTGCARSEPKFRTHFRRPHTLQVTKHSHVLPSTVTGFEDINAPYNKHFIHSKSQQYRRLKTEWRNYVYLGRSRIQGLGLYAARDIERHTMVIEYIGELIRNEVAEKREKIYESQNRGIYMFRISDNTVVDATIAGGLARYINHSCMPCCVAEVVPFEKDCKIIIIANRRIARGEELTYDYKFDFEDESHKIPCMCGAPNCRKWMN